MIKLLLPLLFTLTTITEATILDVDSKRLIRITGVINSNIFEQANQLLELAKDKDKRPIYIMLNSPGGQVFPGETFIDVMGQAKAMGIKVVCFSPVYAASMAFNIMLHCNKNYVLKHTKLLFHPVRIMGYKGIIKAKDAESIAKKLLVIDQELLSILNKKMSLSKKDIDYHYHQETYWNGKDLASLFKNKFFEVVDGIIGVKNLFELPTKNGRRQGIDGLPTINNK